MGHGSKHEAERGEMILQLTNLGNIGGDFHNLGDLPQVVANGGSPGDALYCLPDFEVTISSVNGVNHPQMLRRPGIPGIVSCDAYKFRNNGNRFHRQSPF